MHASIYELLEIKNGEHTKIREHVSGCQRCQAELEDLHAFESNISLEMFDAADKIPSDDVWLRIQDSLEEPRTAKANNVHAFPVRQSHSLTKPIYALAASIAFVGVIAIFMFAPQKDSQVQTQLIQASLNELMLNSRGLEQVLQKVADQNQALSVANQKAADRLYWRLTYVDQLIDQENPENNERVEALWNDRIEALTALNQIYYQHDTTLNAPEI